MKATEDDLITDLTPAMKRILAEYDTEVCSKHQEVKDDGWWYET